MNFRITILYVAVTFYDFIYVACKMYKGNVVKKKGVPEAEYFIQNGTDNGFKKNKKQIRME